MFFSLHAEVQILGVRMLDVLLGQPLGVQFCQVFHAGENVGDLVPCGFVDNAGCRQPEDFLKGNDSILCDIVKIAGSFADFGNGRVVSGNGGSAVPEWCGPDHRKVPAANQILDKRACWSLRERW